MCALFLCIFSTHAEAKPADLNCDGMADVSDVQLVIFQALGLPLSSVIDANNDGIHDDTHTKNEAVGNTEIGSGSLANFGGEAGGGEDAVDQEPPKETEEQRKKRIRERLREEALSNEKLKKCTE